MTSVQCPLPDLHEALSPYIHTRQETAWIRANVNQTLTATQEGLSVLDLQKTDIELNQNALQGCSGVRRAYSRALDAHRQAQAKLERLRKDIDALQHSAAVVQQPRQQQNEAFQESMAAIRARRQMEKLTIVENAFHQLLLQSESKPGLKEVLEEHATKTPHMPSASKAAAESSSIEESVQQLKRAVIQAERHAGAASETATSVDVRPSLSAQAHALSRTRDFLIHFIEEQLSKIPEDAFESENDPAQPQNGAPNADTHKTNRQDILALYDQYVDARRSLVSVLIRTERGDVPKPPIADSSSTNSNPVAPPPNSDMSIQVLPYITNLLQEAETKEVLLQQSTYLRKQIKTSENAIHLAVSRLADESLIVEPGIDKTRAWADAAAEGRRNDAELVTLRLKTGIEAIEKATAVMTRLHGLT